MTNTGTTDTLNAEQAEALLNEIETLLGDKFEAKTYRNDHDNPDRGWYIALWVHLPELVASYKNEAIVKCFANTQDWYVFKTVAQMLARSLEIAEQDAWINSHPVLPEVSDLELVAENGPVLFEADFIV